MTHNEIVDKLKELQSDYWVYLGNDTICLDGDYSIEELKLFVQLMELNNRRNEKC